MIERQQVHASAFLFLFLLNDCLANLRERLCSQLQQLKCKCTAGSG